MPPRVPPIARIRLARSLPRMMLAPAIFALAGAAAAAAGLLVGGAPGLALAGLGAIVIALAGLGALALLSVRLEVEESAVGVSWMGGRRIYPLSPGPVTRVRLRGEHASRLRARSGGLGWALGPARLREDEAIEVVRLAPTRTVILVPTQRGRLAIAAASDDELLDALSRAARARRRFEALFTQPAAAALAPPPPPPREEPEAAGMTGIERAQLQERLDEERAASNPSAVEGEAMTTMGAATAVAATPAEIEEPAARRRLRLPRPVVLVPRPGRRAAFVLLPMAGAGMAWSVGLTVGTMPGAGTDLGRLTSLALVLAGPATSVAVIMALTWWPRIAGVVVAGGLAASVFIGRALIGA